MCGGFVVPNRKRVLCKLLLFLDKLFNIASNDAKEQPRRLNKTWYILHGKAG